MNKKITSLRFVFLIKVSCLMVVLSSFSGEREAKREVVKQTNVNAHTSEVVVEWYSLIKTLTKKTKGYSPPVAARAFGYTGVALYEALVEGMPNRRSMSGMLSGLEIKTTLEEDKIYYWPAVANGVLAEMTKYFYKNTASRRYKAILALESKFEEQYILATSEEIYRDSYLLAKRTAEKIIQWSGNDGGRDGSLHNYPPEYTSPIGDEYWTPTPPEYHAALQPYWGTNRPFVTSNVEETQPKDPIPFSKKFNSQFYKAAEEVYYAVKNITPEQKDIAEFWADDPTTTATPPGHSISILNQVIKKDDCKLDLAVEAFAKVGIGISDAFISCWKTKYRTVYPRPITYINTYIDEEWEAVLATPPFPEYTSGHSVQSGVLAEILTNLFGKEYYFVDRTHEGRRDINGFPRTYINFYEMAEEAAISRLYGGIHYREAIEFGLEQGYKIGKNVNSLDLIK
ncbi:vanadium-dependent haloperoxidase [Aquimarina sp. 2201CG5-10]|uniref:vanadium-dependent haloperoxidase n=1 Tax=Aquimarina callyspongiae TaxID=3098150 RepID=UPI002AB45CD9|nr:vanadium-dependent haloperoxidase [Aquimarina sp. 2201CG5-10]MDY8133962.1 vanadium-dependent haloperoxidase [Aquimarina sp. 2201CG5-10]